MTAAQKLNAALHALIGVELCDSACTHVVSGRWTMLGLAKAAGRVEERETAEAE